MITHDILHIIEKEYNRYLRSVDVHENFKGKYASNAKSQNNVYGNIDSMGT